MSEGIVTPHNTITQVLEDFGNEMQEKMQNSLASGGGLASGALSQSIKFESKIMGSTFVFQLSLKDYYEWVDKGRKAGKQPPLKNIIEWVNTKATFGGYTPPGKIPIRDIPNISDKAVQKGLAFAIARKIGKKGTKGNDFYSDAVTDARLDKLRKDLALAASGDMKTVITDSFKRLK
jgi:hypothetical protein